MKRRKNSGELRAQILLRLRDHSRSGSPNFVSDEELVSATGEPLGAIQEQLDILEAKGLTTTANAHQGRRARISPPGLLAAEQLETSSKEPGSGRIGFGGTDE